MSLFLDIVCNLLCVAGQEKTLCWPRSARHVLLSQTNSLRMLMTQRLTLHPVTYSVLLFFDTKGFRLIDTLFRMAGFGCVKLCLKASLKKGMKGICFLQSLVCLRQTWDLFVISFLYISGLPSWETTLFFRRKNRESSFYTFLGNLFTSFSGKRELKEDTCVYKTLTTASDYLVYLSLQFRQFRLLLQCIFPIALWQKPFTKSFSDEEPSWHPFSFLSVSQLH